MSVDVLFLCLTACVKGSTCREFLLTGRAASVAAPRPVVTESLRTKIRKVFIPFRRSRTESVFSEPVESFFFRWWENPVSASGFSSSPTDFPVALMGTAVSVGRHSCRPRACVVASRRFFIRVCGNRRQRRGDIHVARVRALLCCVDVRHVRSVAFVPPACAPSCLDDVCLSASVPGVINGTPTGYATVRSWCPAVFSSVHVGTAVSVGATFMSPACVRCCIACAPLCLVGVCLSASVPGVINGAPTGYATVQS